MSFNKATGYDGISDNWIRNNKNLYLINDLWNNKTMKKLYEYKSF